MCGKLKFWQNNHIHMEDDKHSLMNHFINSIKTDYFND